MPEKFLPEAAATLTPPQAPDPQEPDPQGPDPQGPGPKEPGPKEPGSPAGWGRLIGRASRGSPSSRAMIALVTFAILLAAALLAAVTWRAYRSSLAWAERGVENTLALMEIQARSVFDTQALLARLVDEHIGASPWSMIAGDATLTAYLDNLTRSFPQIAAIALADPSGAVVSASRPLPTPPPNIRYQSYFLALATAGAASSLGTPSPGPVRGFGTIDFAYRRNGPGATFDGLVLVTLAARYFEQSWTRMRSDKEAVATLFTADGVVLAHQDNQGTYAERLPPDSTALTTALNGRTETYRVYSLQDRLERISAVRQIQGYPIYLHYGVSVHGALQAWRRTALINGSLVLLTTSLLLALVLSVGHHARAESAAIGQLQASARQLQVEADRRAAVETRLAQALARTVDTLEVERQRVSDELRDTLGRYLTTLKQGARAIAARTDAADATRAAVLRLKGLCANVGQEVSRIAWELRPAALDDIHFEAAMQQYLEHWHERSGISFDLQVAPGRHILPHPVAITLYRVLQEAVGNIVRHARAQNVSVVLDIRATEVSLVVEDDGVGLHGGADAELDAGTLGLASIRERLSAMGGTLEIESAPGHGTTLFARMPLLP